MAPAGLKIYTFPVMTNIKKELGQRIRLLRKRKGLTQEEMADKCGLHWTYIGGLERGEPAQAGALPGALSLAAV